MKVKVLCYCSYSSKLVKKNTKDMSESYDSLHSVTN